jgi:site-specific recombinase XerD
MDEIDIYEIDQALTKVEKMVGSHNPISERNSELIKDFEAHCFTSGLTKIRIVKYMRYLRKIAERLGKDFDSATREDIERVVNYIERSDYSPWTKHDYKVTLKRFYKWLRGGEEYPPEVKWIKTTIKQKDLTLPEGLLTEEEVLKLVESANNPRDKAFIITLYESGARIGEVGGLRIKDVSFERGYARVMLRGKTGARNVIVIAASPYLKSWIQNHPARDDPKSPLWVNLGRGSKKYKAISYPALAKILKVVAEKAGLKKRIHPHILRHSRATFLASKLTEAQMNQVFGWKQGSEMPSIYVHLSGRDLDDAIMGVYGLKKVKEQKTKLLPKTCPQCREINEIDARFCKICGMPLDLEVAIELEQRRRQADEIMNLLLRDPEVVEIVRRKLLEIKGKGQTESQ